VVIAARTAGRWLMREDILSSGHIVVLRGSLRYRARGSTETLPDGECAGVWVSRPENPAADLQKFGIRFVEEEYNREILILQGAPESSAHPFPIRL
jgi:hypothetical protein